MKQITRRLHVAILAAVVAGAVHAQAPSFPNQTIKIILGGSPGGSLDASARLLADGLQAQLKQPVIVDYKAGAGGVIAADFVAKSKPDGHTLLVGTTGVAILPFLQKGMPYQPADLQPVAISMLTPMVLFTGTRPETSSVQKLVAYAKANPGKASAGSAEGTTLLTSLLFQSAAGIQAIQARHKGNQPMITDIVGGNVDFGFTGATALKPLADAGRLKLLGVASDHRLPILPDVPTLAEQGIKGAQMEAWSGLMVPKGTDPAVIRVLERAIETVVKSDAYIKKISEVGSVPRFMGAQAATTYIADEAKVLGNVANQAGIKPE